MVQQPLTRIVLGLWSGHAQREPSRAPIMTYARSAPSGSGTSTSAQRCARMRQLGLGDGHGAACDEVEPPPFAALTGHDELGIPVLGPSLLDLVDLRVHAVEEPAPRQERLDVECSQESGRRPR